MLSLQLNLEDGQIFCLTEGKSPHEGPCYFHQHYFSLEVPEFLILINLFFALSGVIVYTNQDEDNTNIIFFQELGFMTEIQILLHYLFPDLSMHMLLTL